MTKTAVGILGGMVLMIGLSAAGVAGRWTLSINTPHGETSMGLVLRQDGRNVTGSVGNPHGGADIPLEGEFVDGSLTFSTRPDAGSEMPAMDFSGKLEDDGTLTGYLSTAMGDMKCVAKRVKE
jgi:hypothetical protein